ncbi:MAG TPA: methyltransferase domain-containing protein [Solirubrobacteraceae bacterium]|jgi:trans-aconitate 2-methyltransferase|nr:methyltransferase domain-containing protein [Solirubrobacteraceae bacterium]
MTTRDWDASTYDQISAPQQAWAREQLERLHLRGDEVVLDAGCGSGKVTAMLAELVPSGRVYAVDVAPSMVEHTRQALGDRVTALCQDLTELSLPEPVDAIFSNATFHWIPDHPKLFAALAATLKPGGQLVAQCGGFGNIDAFRALADEVAGSGEFAPYFSDWKGPWNYARADITAERLSAVGFVDVQTWLEPGPTTLEDPESFVRTVCLVRHLDPLPAGLQPSFIRAVLARAGTPLVLEYIRLNMLARLPGETQ